jgi:glycosyltransferase involved in cell wall biosynthesis
VTTGHLIARKRHRDVLDAIARLPGVDYLVIGDGPERERLQQHATSLGIADRVAFTGQLEHAEALARTRRAHVFAMPSTDEAFGVAYVEAMAGWLPAIGASAEPGPEEIAGLGGGMTTISAGDVEALAEAIRTLVDDAARAQGARETVERHFSWEACGSATVAAYEDALGADPTRVQLP